MSGFVDTVNNSRGTWNFFLFAIVSSCIVTMATFFFFLLGFHEKFQAIDWPLLVGSSWSYATIYGFWGCGFWILVNESWIAMYVIRNSKWFQTNDFEFHNFAVPEIRKQRSNNVETRKNYRAFRPVSKVVCFVFRLVFFIWYSQFCFLSLLQSWLATYKITESRVFVKLGQHQIKTLIVVTWLLQQ